MERTLNCRRPRMDGGTEGARRSRLTVVRATAGWRRYGDGRFRRTRSKLSIIRALGGCARVGRWVRVVAPLHVAPHLGPTHTRLSVTFCTYAGGEPLSERIQCPRCDRASLRSKKECAHDACGERRIPRPERSDTVGQVGHGCRTQLLSAVAPSMFAAARRGLEVGHPTGGKGGDIVDVGEGGVRTPPAPLSQRAHSSAWQLSASAGAPARAARGGCARGGTPRAAHLALMAPRTPSSLHRLSAPALERAHLERAQLQADAASARSDAARSMVFGGARAGCLVLGSSPL